MGVRLSVCPVTRHADARIHPSYVQQSYEVGPDLFDPDSERRWRMQVSFYYLTAVPTRKVTT